LPLIDLPATITKKEHGIASMKNHKHLAAMSQGLDSANTFNLGKHLKSSLLEMSECQSSGQRSKRCI
jgi:hypothetical protein